MKNLDLSAYGISELSYDEQIANNGGTEIGYWIGYYVTEAAKAVKDVITSHGDDVAGSGNAAAVVAYK
jgi:hypothetical protein